MNEVLAMYDIRGKQSYIYRKGALKEIVGASCIIQDFKDDYLKKAVNEVAAMRHEALFDYESANGKGEAFAWETWEKHRKEGYIGEVVYNGGGNLFLIFQDKDTCDKVTRRVTKRLIEETGTLRVLCARVQVSDEKNFVEDRRRLYAEHTRLENADMSIAPVHTFPITQVDYETSMPLCAESPYLEKGGRGAKVSKESYRKLVKYRKVSEEKADEYGEKILDNILSKNREDSLLAVVYIDGNNMGAKVQACLDNEHNDYETCVQRLREFSSEIKKTYVQERVEAINAYLNQDKHGDGSRRFVVYAGDEMTFICKAGDALKLVEAYFKDLPKNASSCAGVTIFHSHAPFSEAYRIAEEACENAKKWMKKNKEADANYVDFHFCQSGIGISLDAIRHQDETEKLLSKPWYLESTEDGGLVIKDRSKKLDVKRIAADMQQLARSNVKCLADRAIASLGEFDLEMNRIYAHQSQNKQKSIQYTFCELVKEEGANAEHMRENRRKLVYDLVSVYDLWFAKEKEEGDDTNE